MERIKKFIYKCLPYAAKFFIVAFIVTVLFCIGSLIFGY